MHKKSFRAFKWAIKIGLLRNLDRLGIGQLLRKLLAYSPSLQDLAYMAHSGFFAQTGWPKTSFDGGCRYPIDKNGDPIPWYSYAMIHFLNERLRPKLTLFEYGSGQSTLYYANKGLIIDAVEEQTEWANKIQKAAGTHARIHLVQDLKSYNRFIHSLEKQFHIIVVDGHPSEERSACLLNSVQALRKDGVMILDDTENYYFRYPVAYLCQNGFKVIHFWGMKPVATYLSCTSILYRPNNCLDI